MAARWLRPAVFCSATVAGLYVLFRIAAARVPAHVEAGSAAPAFSAVTLDKPSVTRTIADFRGTPVLLNVWATWCDPCREEMPSMQRLYDSYKDRGLRIVAVSIDDAGNESLIREFVAEHHLTFDILHDSHADIMAQYQVVGVPQSFLISRSGEIVGTRYSADWSTSESRELVERLLLTPGAPR